MKVVVNFLIDNWVALGPAVYEILARVIPTKKNFSIVEIIFKILNVVIPNRRK